MNYLNLSRKLMSELASFLLQITGVDYSRIWLILNLIEGLKLLEY